MRRLLPAVVAALFLPGGSVSAQWPVGQGAYWTKASVFYHSTTTQYRSNGDERDFLNNNAVSESVAFFLDGLVGVTDRLDVWLQVPYFDLSFNDDTVIRESAGFGDIRASARFNLLRLRGGSIPISARVTTKIPVADLTIDAEVIPLGEGQWDYEVWLESGVSLWPLPAYSVVWVGYRWRSLNDFTTRQPGDEFVFLAEFGGTELVGGLGGKVVVEGLFGRPGLVQGIQLGRDDRRQILYAAPTALFNFSESTILEVAARIPLMGKNFPAGAPLQLGIFHTGRFVN